MDSRVVALGIFTILFASSLLVLTLDDENETKSSQARDNFHSHFDDPLMQGDGHDHMNASQHAMGTSNIDQLAFKPLTTPGNAEVSVARSPDGRTYTRLLYTSPSPRD